MRITMTAVGRGEFIYLEKEHVGNKIEEVMIRKEMFIRIHALRIKIITMGGDKIKMVSTSARQDQVIRKQGKLLNRVYALKIKMSAKRRTKCLRSGT